MSVWAGWVGGEEGAGTVRGTLLRVHARARAAPRGQEAGRPDPPTGPAGPPPRAAYLEGGVVGDDDRDCAGQLARSVADEQVVEAVVQLGHEQRNALDLLVLRMWVGGWVGGRLGVAATCSAAGERVCAWATSLVVRVQGRGR